MEKIKIKYFALMLTVLTILIFAGCAKKDYGTEFTTEPITDSGYVLEKVDIQIPGLTQEYNILVVADLHIICENDEISQEDLPTVKGRINAFSPDGGKTTAAKLWNKMPEMLDNCNADMIFFVGDMVDFSSEGNVNLLRDGLNSLKTPYYYVKADHDVLPYYLVDKDDDAALARQSDIGVNSNIWYEDLGEVIILCYNRSDRAVSEEGLNIVKEAIALNKPIVLVTHVPYSSIVDASLDDMNRELLGGKNLTWAGAGSQTEYVAFDGAGAELIAIIQGANSPITEIVAGHLHFSWDGQVTETTHQHIFDAAFKKNIGYITISGTN